MQQLLALDGVFLRKGDASANSDPLLSVGKHAHLAWSAGPHTCPAKGLARLIATAAIETLLDRLPDLEAGRAR